MQTQTLQLIFNTDNDKTYTINIDKPKMPVDPVAVKSCVDTILSSGIFHSKNGGLVSVKEVNLVTKTVDAVNLA